MTVLGTPIQGVTLYSYTRAFHGRRFDLEGLIREVARLGHGPGLEVVGFSSFRGFPHLDDAFVGWFRDLVAEVELIPTTLSVNADIGIRRDRMLDQAELVEYMRPQIEAAARLGFSAARVQISLSPDAMEALLPLAEENEITLALEVHADQYAGHPRILALRDRFEKIGSPLLGFTADWGATVTGFAPSLIEAYRRRGVGDELLSAVVELWQRFAQAGPPADQDEHGERFGAFIGLAAQHGHPELGVDFGVNATGLFGPAPIEGWREIAPWLRHVHAKFFGIDENGEEPSVPLRQLTALLVDLGYSGAVTSEYEGWHWNSWQEPFGLVGAQQAVQRAAAEAAGSHMVTDAVEARAALAAHLGHGTK